MNGILLHEDVNVAGVNITPATTFTVADPASMVFRANVPTEDIYYVTVGSPATIAIDGLPARLTGTVVKVYPSKTILSGGQAVYQVDIASDDLMHLGTFDQSGTAVISTNAQNVALVPVWTVLGGSAIWVDNNGTPELRHITAGKIHGNEIEVTSGLSPEDKIIVDPKYIPARMYQFL